MTVSPDVFPATAPPSALASQRFGGLDGLRAIAVVLVVVYHLFPGVLPGGFLGVDVFFVISGFLISSLILRERDRTGSFRFRAFWVRRARRLFPALALVLLVCTSLALLLGGDLLVHIGAQIAGSAFFVSNWVYLASGADYFTRDAPELFRNTWSLSIEEQFYLFLPLALIAALRLRRLRTRVLPFLSLGVLSAALMWLLSTLGASASRVYFGTDTHAFGLLCGVVVALLLHRSPEQASSPLQRAAQKLSLGSRLTPRLLTEVLALGGLGVLLWLSFSLEEGSALSFQGGLQLATLAALVVVASVTRPGSRVGVFLDSRPLRWIGERSYGLYLWHWPLLLIFTAALRRVAPAEPSAEWGATSSWIVAGLTLATTLAASQLSYTYVEQPIRRLGFRRCVSRALALTNLTVQRRRVLAGLTAVLIVTVPMTLIAVVVGPATSSAEEAISRGSDVRDDDVPPPVPSEQVQQTPQAPVPPPAGPDLTAVGDSVMLASLPELETRFPGIRIDAEVSRGVDAGTEILESLTADGEQRPVVIAGLGTNGPVTADQLQALHRATGGGALILVTAHAERDWIVGVNQELQAFADSHRGVVLAEWDALISGTVDTLADDEIHPNPSGGEIYADAIAAALTELDSPQEALGLGLPRR